MLAVALYVFRNATRGLFSAYCVVYFARLTLLLLKYVNVHDSVCCKNKYSWALFLYTDALGRASTEEDEFIEMLRVFFLKVNRTNIYF